jgi:hypothetical protein
MTAFDQLDLSPLFNFAAMKIFAEDGTFVNLTTALLSSLDVTAQTTLR